LSRAQVRGATLLLSAALLFTLWRLFQL